MKKIKALVALVLVAGGMSTALAQMSPVGTWRSMDEKENTPKAQVKITEADGVVSGKVEALLRKGADPNQLCTECKDELKDKPMVGMTLISGVRKAEGKEVWEGGKILDPENGKTYTVRLTPIDDGKKLEVRGSIGPFWRTQTWVRVQ